MNGFQVVCKLYGVSRAKDWVSVDCGTNSSIIPPNINVSTSALISWSVNPTPLSSFAVSSLSRKSRWRFCSCEGSASLHNEIDKNPLLVPFHLNRTLTTEDPRYNECLLPKILLLNRISFYKET